MGNDKISEKDIRELLSVAEGDLFSMSDIMSSYEKLMGSPYFEQVIISPDPSDTDDKMNLRVEVRERLGD